MTEPERALEQARAAAATMRSQGAYLEDRVAANEAAGADTLENLFEWAMIDPDLREVRSTRRLGAPVTLLKRGLVRLLSQYHAELIAQQTRFNVHVLGQLRRLETRIDELERIVGAHEHGREHRREGELERGRSRLEE